MAVPMLAGAALMGGLGLMGGIHQNRAQQRSQARQIAAEQSMMRESHAFQGQQAQAQMDFQERMSSTAHQRQMEDMKKAGINPMLASQQGGAAVPSGAAGHGGQGHASSAQMGDPIGDGITSAMEAARFKKETQAVASTVDLNKYQGWAAEEAAKLSQQTAFRQNEESKILSKKNRAMSYEIDALKEEYKTREERAKTERRYIPYEAPMRLFQQGASTARDIGIGGGAVRHLLRSSPRRRGTGTTRDGTNFDLRTGEVLP